MSDSDGADEPPFSDLLERISAWPAVPGGELDPIEPPADLWERLDGETTAERVRVVSKRRYCQRCEHFAEPPRTACTREGTEIEALVGTDRFRVRNCPVERP
ncbi:MAG: hypothetical protein QXG03_03380 [Halalkalicoccus sp.]